MFRVAEPKPVDQHTLRRFIGEWSRKQPHHVFKGVIGAVDGILIKIKCPSDNECRRPAKFWCRKGYYSVNMQAVVDAYGRFIYAAVDMPGALLDCTALR